MCPCAMCHQPNYERVVSGRRAAHPMLKAVSAPERMTSASPANSTPSSRNMARAQAFSGNVRDATNRMAATTISTAIALANGAPCTAQATVRPSAASNSSIMAG